MASHMSSMQKLRYCSLAVSLAFLIVASSSTAFGQPTVSPLSDSEVVIDIDDATIESDTTSDSNIQAPSASDKPKLSCTTQSPKDRYLLLVSTMDGKVSGMNLNENGKVQWTIDVGSSPLLSSSISRLEMQTDGRITYLIPALDGRLYHLDGDAIEPLAFTADTLLTSAFRFNEDSVIVGGRGYETYGYNLNTGKYTCSAAECKQFGAPAEDDHDILIITRTSKTVRAVEMTSGEEKWNFSVGEHDIAYITKAKKERQQYEYIAEENAIENIIPADSCASVVEDDVSDNEWFDFEWFESKDDLDDIEFRVVVPSGKVTAVRKSQPSTVLWQHKFSSAIANAWMLKDGEVSQVSLFDDKNIPALSSQPHASEENAHESPAMYVGTYNDQLYIQPSLYLLQAVEDAALHAMVHGTSVVMPRVRWTPYIATAASRTPAVTSQRNPLQLTWDKEEEETKEVSIYHEQYPYDAGYFLFTDSTPVTLHVETILEEDTNEKQIIFGKYMSAIMLWNWWKEVVAGTAILTILLHIFIVKSMKKYNLSRTLQNFYSGDISTKDKDDNAKADESSAIETEKPIIVDVEESKPAPFISNYYQNFEQIACLGKGGFGVVFQARKKMEDHEYAIKRIALHNNELSKQKVMREVKALAKLDHNGIVRYHNSWFEDPPVGWQEEIDKKCADMASFTPTPGYTTEYTPTQLATPNDFNHNPLHSRVGLEELRPFQIQNQLGTNPLRLFGGSMSDVEELSETQDRKKGSTTEFTPSRDSDNIDSSSEESGSFSLDSNSINMKTFQNGDSFDISFRNSESQYSYDIPFNKYGNGNHVSNSGDSLDIVFEDSGVDDTSLLKTHNGVNDNTSSHSSKHKNFSARQSKNVTPNKHSRNTSANRPSNLELTKNSPTKHEKRANLVTPGPKIFLYIQMQLCQKESLKDWLTNNTLNRSRERLLDLYHQVVSAVQFLHDYGMMHRDLKPSNIFFSMDGMVKVGDFGLVTALEEERDDEMDSLRNRSSRHTDQVGTKLYMSPEQVSKKKYTYKVDIYALGVIFFECFYPFNTEMERLQTLKSVRNLSFPERFIRELPEEHLFLKPLLSHDPVQRPDAVDILDSKLMKEADKVIFERCRATSKSRSRTMSSSSSTSSL